MDNYAFYKGRIMCAPSYGFIAGHEILEVVSRCAQNDSTLTKSQIINIITLCDEAHKFMMEENFRNGWTADK